jgi:tetratricopeptide (TPR) repeat protein
MVRWKLRQGWPDAERFFRRALEANPDYFPALDRLSQVLPERSSERLEVLQRAAAIQDNQLLLLRLGDYYRTVLREHDIAYETYRRIQCIWPRDKTAYLRLIDLCRRMGRLEESKVWSAKWQANKDR